MQSMATEQLQTFEEHPRSAAGATERGVDATRSVRGTCARHMRAALRAARSAPHWKRLDAARDAAGNVAAGRLGQPTYCDSYRQIAELSRVASASASPVFESG